MKKIILISLFLYLQVCHAGLLIFDSSGCPNCKEVLEYLKNNNTNEIEVLELNIPKNYRRFLLEAEKRGKTNAWPGKLPVVITSSKILRGKNEVFNFFIKNKKTNEKKLYKKLCDSYFPFKFRLIFLGLLDGINPCAFALIIFLCVAMRLAGTHGRRMLFTALIFILSIGGTYFLFGIGLLQSLKFILMKPYVRVLLYKIMSAFCLIAALISLLSAIKKNSVIRVPKHWRKWLQKNIQKKLKQGVGFTTIIIMGIISAGVESVCTGQIYLPTLIMIERESGGKVTTFVSLLLYNIAFIIPLILIAFCAFFGLKTIQFERLGKRRAQITNVIFIIIFLFFTFFLWSWK